MDPTQSSFDVSRSWHGAFYGNLLLGKFNSVLTMAIRVVEFSNGGYKIRKVFA